MLRPKNPKTNHVTTRIIMVYFFYFHLIMSYGIIFWGAAPHSINIFRLYTKKIKNNHKYQKKGVKQEII
jgi:hypothetical protein